MQPHIGAAIEALFACWRKRLHDGERRHKDVAGEDF